MAENLPIDIHSSKLLDWLISRRHCTKEWQKNVLVIREKIKHAIQDMPESEEIVNLLQRSYINFFHCARIVEILRDTEKDSKNFLGYYSSQRMKDWQEIEGMYKKDNVHLAESAQMLQRMVHYEIPALKKQITKSSQAVEDCARKEKDYLKQADEGRKLYEKELTKMGLLGKSLRAELLALAADLPALFLSISNDVIGLLKAFVYYRDFRNYMHQGKAPNTLLLPLIGFLIEKGPAVTAYEFKYGRVPTRIEAPNFDLLLRADEKVPDEDDDEIDFGAEDDVIDFGDDVAADIDFGDDVAIDVVADDTGAVGESIASGEDALTLVENPRTQRQLKAELSELLAFLSMRREDEERETAADLLVRTTEQRPKDLAQVSTSDMKSWIGSIESILSSLNNPQKVHLFNIRSSPQFVEKIVSELETKRGLEARYKRMASLMTEKQAECRDTVAKNTEELKLVVDNTRQLQKQVEEEISKKYSGRRVNIMGGINAALANL